MQISIEESKTCKICNVIFNTFYEKIIHLKTVHNLTHEQYIVHNYYNSINPTCKCGCETKLSFKSLKQGPWFSEYTKNHFPRKKHTDETKDKIRINTKNAIIKKYGVDNIFKKNKDLYVKKIKETKKLRYGDENYNNIEKNKSSQLNKFYKKLLSSNRLNSEYVPEFNISEYSGVDNNKKYKFKHIKCGYIFECTIDNGKMPRCKNCYPFNFSSIFEDEIYTFIRELLPSEIILRNDRIVLENIYELDIYLPNKNIAIEHNGLYTHSEIGGNKNKNYHLGKTKFCYKKGIRLLHIFEDEWIDKKNIIKSIIKNLFQLYDKTIYARNCTIRKITPHEKADFLESHHIQGNDSSSIKLGAFYNDELVSVMTFGPNRIVNGNKNINNTFELYRFSTKYKIIGVASKLLKYFIRNYNPNEIITYSDRRYFTGNTYEKIGFKFDGATPPNYWYMKNYSNRLHRFNFRKSILHKKLEIFDPKLTEWENMQLNGYDRIWDCGSLKYKMIL